MTMNKNFKEYQKKYDEIMKNSKTPITEFKKQKRNASTKSRALALATFK